MLMYLSFGIILLRCLRCLHTFTQWSARRLPTTVTLRFINKHIIPNDQKCTIGKVNYGDISIVYDRESANGTNRGMSQKNCFPFKRIPRIHLHRTWCVCRNRVWLREINCATRRMSIDELADETT